MQNRPDTFPWYFLYRFAKYHFFIVLLAVVSSVYVYRQLSIHSFEKNLKVQQEKKIKTLEEAIQDKTPCQELPWGIAIYKNGKEMCLRGLNPEAIEKNEQVQKFMRANYTLYLNKPVVQSVLLPIDQQLILAIILLFFVLYFFTLLSGIRIARPLKSILQKVSNIETKLPFDEKLKLFYQRDEWARIEAALSRTEINLRNQFRMMDYESQKNAILLESIFDGIMAIDNFQNSLFYNSKFEKTFIKSDSVLSEGIKLWRLFRKQAEVVSCYQECIKSASPQSLKAFRYKQHYFDLSVAPLIDTENNVTGAVGVFHDVTESKLTEQMRVDFVANVSHEIRTPLTSIKGFTQVLQSQQEKFPKEMGTYLDKILFNSERLLVLFSDLLNLSVIESQNQLSKKEIDLKEMIHSIKDSLRVTYQEKGVKITSDLKEPTVWADKKLIEQAIINLIDNACKYTFENTEIIISNFVKDDKVIISISDSGPGISKEHLHRIFERFYRVDSSRANSNVRGTGLGLSIVKHIVRKHGGKVWAQSEPQKGTVFFIELPQKRLEKHI